MHFRNFLIALGAAACPLVAAAQYGGGAGDGHDVVLGDLTLSSAPIAPLFGGGAGDGHDVLAATLTLSAAPIAALYGGGAGDGHDFRTARFALTSGPLTALYGGGAGDGHDVFTASLSLSGGPLPATLLTFTAEPTDAGTVRIAWTVADERDVDHYAVERGADATAFAEVGRAAAAANSTAVHAYALTDAAPLPGASYYRLRTVDVDGSSELSDVVVVLLPGGDEAWTLAVFPNPVASGQALHVASEGLAAETPLTLTIHDATGRVVIRETIVGAGGREVFELPALGLAPGTYRLRLHNPDAVVQERLLAVVK